MKRLRSLLLLSPIAAGLFAGCAQPAYYPPPPPPPPPPVYAHGPGLIEMADQNGFRAGMDDGGRDLYYGRGYRPQEDRKFRAAPGYDPNFGPRGPYVDHFRSAYLHGYDKAYYHRP